MLGRVSSASRLLSWLLRLLRAEGKDVAHRLAYIDMSDMALADWGDLHRLEGSVIFVDTESKFQAGRLAEMAWTRHPELLMMHSPALNATLSRVMLINPRSIDELIGCLGVRQASDNCLARRLFL